MPPRSRSYPEPYDQNRRCRSTSSNAGGCTEALRGARSPAAPSASRARRALGESRRNRSRAVAPPAASTGSGQVRYVEKRRGEREAARRERLAETRRSERRAKIAMSGSRAAPRAPGRGLPGGLGVPPLPALGDPHQGRLRGRQRRRRPDVRRRGARRGGGPPGACRSSGAPGGLLNELLGTESAWSGTTCSSQRRSSADRPGNRDPQPTRSRPAGPTSRAGRADRAARDLHPRELLHEAADRQPDRDHQGPGARPAPHARRADRLPAAALPPRGRPADARRGRRSWRPISPASRTCSSGRSPRRRPPKSPRRPTEEPRPAPQASQLGFFGWAPAPGAPGREAPHRVGRRRPRRRRGDRRPPRAGRRRPRRAGDSAAGKTTLIRGASRALGRRGACHLADLHDRPALWGRLPVSHLDLHRLENGSRARTRALLEDYLDPDAVAFIEWPRPGRAGAGAPAAR